MSTRLSDRHVQDYRQQGYCLLASCLPTEHLELLRGRAQASIAAMDAKMDAEGVDSIGLAHRGKRYFSAHSSHQHPELYDFIYSELMADSVRKLLGDDVWIFFEQYVIKCAESDNSFSWHQDSGYVAADTPHRPYLTCWVALDEITADNGGVFLLPYQRADTRERVEHEIQEGTNDKVGYFGDDPGDYITCPAGSIAFFSSTTFHRSGANLTDHMRRVYLIQYSGEAIIKPDGQPWARSERFLADGQLVGERLQPIG